MSKRLIISSIIVQLFFLNSCSSFLHGTNILVDKENQKVKETKLLNKTLVNNEFIISTESVSSEKVILILKSQKTYDLKKSQKIVYEKQMNNYLNFAIITVEFFISSYLVYYYTNGKYTDTRNLQLMGGISFSSMDLLLSSLLNKGEETKIIPNEKEVNYSVLANTNFICELGGKKYFTFSDEKGRISINSNLFINTQEENSLVYIGKDKLESYINTKSIRDKVKYEQNLISKKNNLDNKLFTYETNKNKIDFASIATNALIAAGKDKAKDFLVQYFFGINDEPNSEQKQANIERAITITQGYLEKKNFKEISYDLAKDELTSLLKKEIGAKGFWSYFAIHFAIGILESIYYQM